MEMVTIDNGTHIKIRQTRVTCVSILSSSKQCRGLVVVVVQVVVSVEMIGFVLHGGGRGGVDRRGGVGGRVWLVKQL